MGPKRYLKCAVLLRRQFHTHWPAAVQLQHAFPSLLIHICPCKDTERVPQCVSTLDMTLLPCRAILRMCKLSFSTCDGAAGQSVKHHLLSSYFHAVLSVALAQFGTNGIVSGMHGIIRLAESSPYIQVSNPSTPKSQRLLCLVPVSHVTAVCLAWQLLTHLPSAIHQPSNA